MILKILRKKIILIVIVIIIALGVIVYQFFLKKEKPKFTLEKVVRGTVLKEVSETGTVKISEETNLSFKNSGRLEKIYVKVGNKVEAGQDLAKLDTSQFVIELTKAWAALEVSQADYDKLLAGSSAEEIAVSETAVLNAKVTLENAEQNLIDVEADAKEDFKNAYEDALNVLDDAYLKIYNAYNVAISIQRSYFTAFSQEGVVVGDNKDIIKSALDESKTYIDDAKSDSQNEKINLALSRVKEALSEIKEALEVIRDMTEMANYRDAVSSTDKTSLDNQRSYIATAHTDVISSQQTISTTKVTNTTNINNAKAEVSAAKAKLQKTEDELILKKAGPQKESIDLYQAKIKQAKAEVSLLQNKIQEAVLKSPNGGQITRINKREGEIVQPTDSVISFLPVGPFQIDVDIYEEDIVNVKPGNSVKITLAAFPDETLQGRIVSIDPAEKLIGGVVYYKVTIDFETQKEGLKPGMTADVVIESNKKENVLVVPKNALKKIDGKKIVKVFENGQIKEREIEVGLVGDEYIEVTFGLSEGEEVVIE